MLLSLRLIYFTESPTVLPHQLTPYWQPPSALHFCFNVDQMKRKWRRVPKNKLEIILPSIKGRKKRKITLWCFWFTWLCYCGTSSLKQRPSSSENRYITIHYNTFYLVLANPKKHSTANGMHSNQWGERHVSNQYPELNSTFKAMFIHQTSETITHLS